MNHKHTWGKWKIRVESASAEEERVCSVCGATEIRPRLIHIPDEMVLFAVNEYRMEKGA